MSLLDNIYVINMDKSTDRLSGMTSQIEVMGKPFVRIPAIVGKDLSSQEVQEFTTGSCNYFCTSSMIGCFLSHKKAWQACIDNGDKYCMILEDDCKLVDTFQQDLNNCTDELSKIDPQWDFLYLGCLGACDLSHDYDLIGTALKLFNPNIIKKLNVDAKYVFIPESPAGFQSYVISQECARKMIGFMDKVDYHVDISFLKHSESFNIYACIKTIGMQYSTVGNSSQTESFPIMINSLADNFKCKKGTSYSYYLSCPVFGIGKFNVNVYLLVLLAIAIALPNKYRYHFSLLIFSYFLLEMAIKPINYEYAMFWSLCILAILGIKFSVPVIRDW